MYLQSTEQRQYLQRLCSELNSSDVLCDVEDILHDFQSLQDVLLNDVLLKLARFKDLLPHRERILHLVLGTAKRDPEPPRRRFGIPPKVWHRPSLNGGPCLLEALTTWLQDNYVVDAHASRGQQDQMLRKLMYRLRFLEHCGFSEEDIRGKIDDLNGRAAATKLDQPMPGSLGSERVENGVAVTSNEPDHGEFGASNRVEETRNAEIRTRESSAVQTHGSSTATHQTDSSADTETLGTRSSPIPIAGDHANDEERSEEQLRRPTRRHRAAPSSLDEVALVAAILRERHDLKERGVPQCEIDEYLLLP